MTGVQTCALPIYNEKEGLALSKEEMDYLKKVENDLGRKLTDSEVFGFAQINSEHCRHKIFGGTFIIDGVEQESSLFQMIKKTTQENPNKIISAYKDNVAFAEEAGEDAILLERVAVWPGRRVPAGARLTASLTAGGLKPPLAFGGGGTLEGAIGAELTAETLLVLGGLLGREGTVGLGWAGGAGARMLAQAAGSGDRKSVV